MSVPITANCHHPLHHMSALFHQFDIIMITLTHHLHSILPVLKFVRFLHTFTRQLTNFPVRITIGNAEDGDQDNDFITMMVTPL